VQRGPTSTFVYVVQADDKVKRRDIVTGPTEGADTSIKTGLVPGEIVVTDGLDKLKDDASVTTREPGKENESRGADAKTGSPQSKETANQMGEAKRSGKKGTK
jgi:multidrug efflux system membrane fusion protein